MLKTRLMKAQIVLALGALLIASCGGGNAADATPTVDMVQVQTLAVETFSAALTQTAIAAPSDTPAPTLTLAPTLPALPTSTAGTPFGAANTPGAPAGGATKSCYGLTFVKDVTIPDNTQMDPGKAFTKTWQVLNSGSCAWETGFKFQSTGGNAMGASAFTLTSAVSAGSVFEISVPMTTPSAAGTVRGNWRMSNASGQFFGDEVFVVIVVGSGSAATTGTATATATATATSTTNP